MDKRKRQKNEDEIVPGMKVGATQGDLGEQDVSPARVTDVDKNQEGKVEAIEITKGTIFRKKLKVPADRIQAVHSTAPDHKGEGEVKVDASESELESLVNSGKQTLLHEDEKPQQSFLDQIEQRAFTTEGMREKESDISSPRPQNIFLRIIGPGLLSGTSGNDPSAVTAYAVDGASAGYGQLWLMLLSTPLYQSVQFACAKIGRISQKGLSQLLREHYGRTFAIIASCLLIITNVALIAADLAAIGSGLELVVGISWVWFVAPAAILLWYLTVFRNFESFKKV